ncbi:H(+)-transporting V1 sector ATPase subunit H [Coemansia thaxteri]|uniref:V-type proton ATPase subunit H n=1 Tax=Coemansia thaxteri TaxID=2663907 RepID=A0A9W8EEN5_9FUNG|nr:H(+)-transporting V1 sector ATPase subunit H [Coemansia thaxteri]KAJ2004624.1 H(+)-transporting V1 sector ATPase subunit H [Coemansia thaxteri]KAJ2472170.1 H(+)-transporting V1 sector ATPase subunit H [Coemansia sp. RSA 2322]KAJ2485347.1 H(+)-transporting V1 sector ATPase subunit H [Coemansia sp. RSA 2320]
MTVPDVPAAMVSNQFFDEFTDKVRVKPIPWEGYSRAGLISSDELRELKEYQHATSATGGGNDEAARLAARTTHMGLLVRLTEKLSSIDALQYLLVQLDDLVSESERVGAGARAEAEELELERAMFRCTEKKDDYLGLKASKILVGALAARGAETQRVFAYTRLFAYLERCMRSELTSVVDVAVQVMQSALRVRRARGVLAGESVSCLTQLVDVLRRTQAPSTSGNGGGGASVPRVRGVVAVPQTQYEVVFCLWLLSFERTIAATLDRRFDVLGLTADIARSAVKEKVVRIVVALWANLLRLAPAVTLPAMLVARVPACLATLAAGRNFKDDDLRTELRQLADDLAERTGVMTTWDEYLNEVASGHLAWSPAHRSEQFWKLHVRRMDEHDHRVVRQLAAVLAEPTAGETALAVACHDLSQYVRLNPDGKRLLARIGAKARVMALMTGSEFPEVRYEALMCVQQIMLNAWRN